MWVIKGASSPRREASALISCYSKLEKVFQAGLPKAYVIDIFSQSTPPFMRYPTHARKFAIMMIYIFALSKVLFFASLLFLLCLLQMTLLCTSLTSACKAPAAMLPPGAPLMFYRVVNQLYFLFIRLLPC